MASDPFGPPIPMENLSPGARLHLLACGTGSDPRMAWGTDVVMDPLLDAAADANRDATTLLSPVHYMIKAADRALTRHPEFNLRIVSGRVRPWADHRILVPFQGREGEARTLLLVGLESMDVPEIARRTWEELLEPGFQGGRALHRESYPLSRILGVRVAGFLFRIALRALDRRGALARGLGPGPGAPVLLNYFGSADVAPMTGYVASRLPMEFPPTRITVGRPVDRPVVEDGEIVARRVSSVTVQGDHRFVDGTRLGRFTRTFRELLERPEALAGPGPGADGGDATPA